MTIGHWRLATLAWACVIWTLSSSPFASENSRTLVRQILDSLSDGRVPESVAWWINIISRKTAHTVEFALLAVLVYMACGFRGRSAWLCAVTAAVAFGIVDEIHQSWVPGRGTSPVDCMLDAVGAVLGTSLLARWRRDPLF